MGAARLDWMRRISIRLLALVLAVFCAIAPSRGSDVSEILRHEHVPGEVLVKFRTGAPPPAVASLRLQFEARTTGRFRAGAERWALGPGRTTAEAIEILSRSALVEYVEPNYVVTVSATPDDPLYPQLWGLHNVGQNGGVAGADIDAEAAWNISTGSSSVVVAVIDTGVDYNHPDLAANIFTNPGEIPGNGVDDDGNGYVDDVRGWDFYNRDNDPWDDHSHGTHCAGTIGAVGNNGVGVAGVAWDVSILPVKFLGGGGSGSTADAILSVEYATSLGVDVMSNSWGGGGFSQALLDAILEANAAGILFVAAAGNYSSNNDIEPFYPAGYDAPNVVSVAATDRWDGLAYFSNFGAVTVDLGAPGVDTLSCIPGSGYDLKSGTSMATPHVSGVAALIRSIAPDVDLATLTGRLFESVDLLPSLAGTTRTGGRLNAFAAIAEPDSTPPGAIADLFVAESTSNSLYVEWTATGDDADAGRGTSYEVRWSESPIDEATFPSANLAQGAPSPAVAGTPERMEIRGLEAERTYHVALRVQDEWGNVGGLSNVASGTTLPPPTFASDPPSFEVALLTGARTERLLTLENAGVGTLDWSIEDPTFAPAQAGPQESTFLEKGAPDPRTGPPAPRGAGGPDGFGYRFQDSDLPDGPDFVWNDIAATGTPVAELVSDDQISEPIPLGFGFEMYGTAFDAVRVSTNGFLTFTHVGAPFTNQPLPGTGAPEFLVAPFWDDLTFGGTARAAWTTDGSKFTVQYTDVSHAFHGGSYTFQVSLHATGVIDFRYGSMAGAVDGATIGIQDGAGTTGLQVAFNSDYVRSGLAVQFSPSSAWLRVAPRAGRLGPGEATQATLSFDAAGLDGGVYESAVVVDSNDPDRPEVSHPVTLTVIGAPDIQLGGPEVVLDSARDYLSSGAWTDHVFVLPAPPAGSGSLELIADGDYGDSGETATAIAEGTTLGSVGEVGLDCTVASGTFPIPAGTLATLSADGQVDVRVANAAWVDAFCSTNRHRLVLRYREPADSLEFGPVFLGGSRALTMVVENLGTDLLQVTSITSDADVFVPSAATLTIPPRTFATVDVTFTPTAVQPFPGTLTITSDDPDETVLTVGLQGEGILAPDVDVSPSSFAESLTTGESVVRTLAISNDGGSPLTFSARVEPRAAPGGADATDTFDVLASSPTPITCVVEDRTEGAVYGQQNWGQSFFRYRAETDRWETLPSAPIGSGNNGGATILGRKIFTSYAENGASMGVYDMDAGIWSTIPNPLGRGTANIASDGTQYLYLVVDQSFVRFDPATGETAFLPPPPFAFQPWGGLKHGNGSLFGHEGNGRTGFARYDVGGGWTTLASLPGGAVLGSAIDPVGGNYYAYGPYSGTTIYRYSAGDGTWSTHTIPFPSFYVNDGGLAWLPWPVPGVFFVQGEAGVGAGRFRTSPEFASVAPESGTVPAGETASIEVRIDATGLFGGDYDAEIVVSSNDPDESDVRVPVRLHVTGAPDIAVSPVELDYGATFVGGSRLRSILVSNVGTDVLTVSAITTSHPDFTATPSEFVLGIGESRPVTVTFAPSAVGALSETLSIASDDPDEAEVTVSLVGEGLLPPDIEVVPESLSEIVYSGDIVTRTLTVANVGESDLVWTAEARRSSASALSPAPGPPPSESPAVAPSGYAPRVSEPRTTSGARVLLVQDYAPWDTSENERILNANGIAYDLTNTTSLGTIDLVPYDMVIVASDQTTDSYLRLAAHMGRLADFVAAGGVLEVHAAGWGWNGGDASVMTLPGGMRIEYYAASTNRVVEPGHPAVDGVPETFEGGAASHGAFVGVPAGATVITVDDRSAPTLVEYAWGSGIVLASGQTLEFYSLYGGPVGRILQNLIPYAHDLAPGWLSISPISGSIPPGGSAAIEVTLDAARLLGGVYEGRVVIASNDPDEAEVTVPVQLEVIGVPDILVGGEPVDLESVRGYTVSGDRTVHAFAIEVTPSAGGTIDLLAEGDYGDSSETATVIAEGTTLGAAGGVGTDCASAQGSFPLDADQLAALAADGTVRVEVQNSPYVDVFCGTDRHTVRLRYAGPSDRLDFGELFVGAVRTISLSVSNAGTDVLTVSAITTSHPDFTATPSEFVLGIGESRAVTVAFAPSAVGALSETLSIASDDPDEAEVTVSLVGEGLLPPDIEVVPASLSETVYSGNHVTRTLTVANVGESDLVWSLSAGGSSTLEEVLEALDARFTEITGVIPGRYDFSEGEVGFSIGDGGNDMYDGGNMLHTNLGGPLAYTNGPIVSSGVLGPGGRYFTRKYQGLFVFAADVHGVSEFRISGNLGADGAGGVDGTILSASSGGGSFRGFVKRVYGAGDPSVNHLVIVEDAPGSTHSFPANTNDDLHQVSGLAETSRIYYLLYAGATGRYIDDAATQGILRSFLEVLGPSWLGVSPTSGTLPAGGAAPVEVTLDATLLRGGDYLADIAVSSNDPDEPEITVPVRLHVIDVPDIEVSAGSLDFGEVFIGYPHTRSFVVSNVGRETLHVTSVTSPDLAVSTDASDFTLEPGASRAVSVTLDPLEVRVVETVLVLESDDPDESTTEISILGVAIVPPDVDAEPLSIEATILAGESTARTLTLRNLGGSDLRWHLDTLAAAVAADPSVATSHALIIQDVRPWGTTSNESVLGANGISWTMIPSTALATTDLGRYRLVIVAGDQRTTFYSTLAARADQLAQYVAGGGVLEVHAAGFGSNSGDASLLRLPGGVRVFESISSQEIVIDPSHPIVAGVPQTFGWPFLGTAAFSSVPDDAQRIVRNVHGQDSLIVYGFGGGIVVASGQNLEHGYTLGAPHGRILANTIPWAYGSGRRWLTVDPAIGSVAAGATVDLAVVMDADGLQPGVHAESVRISSNDPDEPTVTVPVTLEVLRLRAKAGSAQVLECSGARAATAVLDGRGSAHMDGPGAITRYLWSEGGVPIGEGETLEFSFGLGLHEVSLRVEDGTGASNDDATSVSVVDTVPPSGTITDPAEGACLGAAASPVTVADDFADRCDGSVVRRYDPTDGAVWSTHGDHAVTLFVSDGAGNAAGPRSVSFTLDLLVPTVERLVEPETIEMTNIMPVSRFFAANDADGARGDVVHETLEVDGCTVYDGFSYGNRDGRLLDETIPDERGTICRMAERCGRRQWVDPQLAFRAKDCGGNEAVSTVVRPGEYAASSCRFELGITVSNAAEGTRISWEPMASASGYDVVRGSLRYLRMSDGAYRYSDVQCVGSHLGTSTVVDEGAEPEPGEGAWYLVRDVTDGQKGRWDEPESSQIGSREAIDSAAGRCP